MNTSFTISVVGFWNGCYLSKAMSVWDVPLQCVSGNDRTSPRFGAVGTLKKG